MLSYEWGEYFAKAQTRKYTYKWTNKKIKNK